MKLRDMHEAGVITLERSFGGYDKGGWNLKWLIMRCLKSQSWPRLRTDERPPAHAHACPVGLSVAEYFRDGEGEGTEGIYSSTWTTSFRFTQEEEVAASWAYAVGSGYRLPCHRDGLIREDASLPTSRSPRCRQSMYRLMTLPTPHPQTTFANLDATTVLAVRYPAGIYPAVDPLDSTQG